MGPVIYAAREGIGDPGEGYDNRAKSSAIIEKAVDSCGIVILPYNLTALVDPPGYCVGGPGEGDVDGTERSPVIDKTMETSIVVIPANDLSLIVDLGDYRLVGAGKRSGDDAERAPVIEKAGLLRAVDADDLVAVVNVAERGVSRRRSRAPSWPAGARCRELKLWMGSIRSGMTSRRDVSVRLSTGRLERPPISADMSPPFKEANARRVQTGSRSMFVIRICVVSALALMAAPPAGAEMFGPGFQPCGEKTFTLAVVECVQANTNVAD